MLSLIESPLLRGAGSVGCGDLGAFLWGLEVCVEAGEGWGGCVWGVGGGGGGGGDI